MSKRVLCAVGTILTSIKVFSSTISYSMDPIYNLCLQEKIKEGEPKCEWGVKYMEQLGYKIDKSMKGHGHSGGVYSAISPKGSRYALKFTRSDASIINLPGHIDLSGPLPIMNWQMSKFCGDMLLYDSLSKNMNGVVDFGSGICKIYGYYKIPNCENKDYDVCIILEYIEGENADLYIETHKYTTTDVVNWFKNIFASLKIMYKNNFWHGSIGKGNIKITKDNHAVLLDFERAYFKDEYEKAINDKNARICMSPINDYYDPYWFGRSVIWSFLNGKGYSCDNKDLENRLRDLASIKNADELADAILAL